MAEASWSFLLYVHYIILLLTPAAFKNIFKNIPFFFRTTKQNPKPTLKLCPNLAKKWPEPAGQAWYARHILSSSDPSHHILHYTPWACRWWGKAGSQATWWHQTLQKVNVQHYWSKHHYRSLALYGCLYPILYMRTPKHRRGWKEFVQVENRKR